MGRLLLMTCLLAPLAAKADEPAADEKPRTESDYLREVYRAEAERHVFYHDAEHRQSRNQAVGIEMKNSRPAAAL